MMSSRVDENSFRSGLFFTPPPKWETSLGDTLPVIPRTESYARRSLYHVRHKVPPANSPYGIAKRVQVVLLLIRFWLDFGFQENVFIHTFHLLGIRNLPFGLPIHL